MANVQLGDRVADCVTGAEGIVIGLTRYISGCDQAMVQPGKMSAEGKLSDALFFDVNRLSVTEAGACKLPNAQPAEKTGGPAPRY